MADARLRLYACGAYILLQIGLVQSLGWDNPNGKADQAVRLTDVQVLTLYNNKMTTYRRTSPMPQLTCVGGTAGCNAFVPQVVQCYNRGSDGETVQWECKTDMDNAYRFGQVEVVCEGYNSPEDMYVLKGSCGLEYTLDYTKEGHEQKNKGAYGGRDSNYGYTAFQPTKPQGGSFATLLTIVAVCFVIYGLYVTCIAPALRRQTAFSSTSDDFGGGPSRPGFFGHGARPSAPPPPGFRTDYTDTGPSCGAAPPSSGSTGGGFWTGIATGGLLGYMFGNRPSTGYGTYSQPASSYWGQPAGTSFGYRDRGASPSSSSSPYSGTRTASAFGGSRVR